MEVSYKGKRGSKYGTGGKTKLLTKFNEDLSDAMVKKVVIKSENEFEIGLRW